MEIDANLNWGPVNNLSPVKRASTEAPPAVESDSFASTNALGEALNNTPDVRAAAVATGKALVSSGNYPSSETVKKLSNFLASRLQAGSD